MYDVIINSFGLGSLLIIIITLGTIENKLQSILDELRKREHTKR